MAMPIIVGTIQAFSYKHLSCHIHMSQVNDNILMWHWSCTSLAASPPHLPRDRPSREGLAASLKFNIKMYTFKLESCLADQNILFMPCLCFINLNPEYLYIVISIYLLNWFEWWLHLCTYQRESTCRNVKSQVFTNKTVTSDLLLYVVTDDHVLDLVQQLDQWN